MTINSLFTRSNNSFARDSVLLTVSKIFTGVIQLVITMILSHNRTLKEYGTYSQMMIVINLVTTVIMLGLPNSISFFLGRAKEKKDRKEFLSTYFILNTALSLLAGVLMLSCIIPISKYFNNPDINLYWFFLLFYPWAYITSSCIENLTVALDKINLLLPFKISHSIIVLSVAGFTTLFHASFKIYVLIFLIVESVYALITYIISVKLSNGFNLKINKQMIKTIFLFSLPIGLASSVGMLNSEIDKFVIGKLMTTEDVAIYANVSRDLPIILIPTSITTVLLPKISLAMKDNKVGDANLIWRKSIVISLSFVALFAFGCLTFAEDIISFLYGAKYLPGTSVFRIFCILLLFRCTYWGLMLNASGNTKFIFVSSLCSLVINAALNIPMFYACGMLGCAISTLISTAIISIVQLIFTAKKFKLRFIKIFPWKKILIILLVNVMLGVSFYYLKKAIPLDTYIKSFWESFILGIVWAGIYLLIFVIMQKKFKFFTEERSL